MNSLRPCCAPNCWQLSIAPHRRPAIALLRLASSSSTAEHSTNLRVRPGRGITPITPIRPSRQATRSKPGRVSTDRDSPLQRVKSMSAPHKMLRKARQTQCSYSFEIFFERRRVTLPTYHKDSTGPARIARLKSCWIRGLFEPTASISAPPRIKAHPIRSTGRTGSVRCNWQSRRQTFTRHATHEGTFIDARTVDPH